VATFLTRTVCAVVVLVVEL